MCDSYSDVVFCFFIATTLYCHCHYDSDCAVTMCTVKVIFITILVSTSRYQASTVTLWPLLVTGVCDTMADSQVSDIHVFSEPPPVQGATELHAYIHLLEQQIISNGGTLPSHRPLVLGPFPERVKSKSAWKSFTAGAVAAVVGGLVTHPIDVVKVRQQLFGMKDGFGFGSSWVAEKRTASLFNVSRSIVETEGVAGLYTGATAGMLRQASFVGTKFVLYEQLKPLFKNDRGQVSFPSRLLCGLSAGFGASIIGNPFDLAMVRMQADGRLPPKLRRNYSNGFDAVLRIIREEGIQTLWRGSAAQIARGSVITASQLAFYDHSKYELAKLGLISHGPLNCVVASVIASVAAGVVSNPFDVAKSRLFQMKRRSKDGKWPYKGLADCLVKTVQSEGAVALWRGLAACIARQLPLNAVRFMLFEKMTVLLNN